MRILLAALLLIGCTTDADPPPEQTGPPPEYPLDGTLRFHHVQMKSTHNSYHIEKEGNTIPELHYTHAPLDVQLESQGVRHFELDLRQGPDGYFVVYHLPIVDDVSHCARFTDCLGKIKGWHDAHPYHHPIVVQLELKDPPPIDAAPAETYFEALHAEITSVMPPEMLFTPDQLQGSAATLGEAVATLGWPTLGELRGKFLFMLDDEGEFRNLYTRGLTSAAGRIVFPDSSPGDPFAAMAVINDPIVDAAAITAAVAANIMVRTRADADVYEPAAGDTTRREAALASGAHFISTDFPAPVEGYDYVVEIPGGTPSRCNPSTAPPECVATELESPDRLK